mgnify:CR=1 FL=1
MAGPVTLTTPVGGTVISSSTFGIPAATNLGIALNRPWVRAYQGSAVTTLTTGTFTSIGFDTEDSGSPDPYGIHSTTTNTSRFTVPTGWAGVWRFIGRVAFATNGSGVRVASFAVNGSSVEGSGTTQTPTGSSTCAVTTLDEYALAVGSYVELKGYQASGGSLSTTVSPPLTSLMIARWIGST